jgi:hypothetical protein
MVGGLRSPRRHDTNIPVRAQFAGSLYASFVLLGLAICVSLFLYNVFEYVRRYVGPATNSFDSVHIRLTHPQTHRYLRNRGRGPGVGQWRGRRRIIHWIQQQTYEEPRRRSFHENFDMLLSVPLWKKRGLGNLQITHDMSPLVRRTSTGSQIGDAFKGSAPDDLILSAESPLHIRRRLLSKIPLFQLGDSDDEEIEPPLTALGADPDIEEGSHRNVRITDGVVALGLAQAGSTLASSIGGAIAPEILVNLENSDKMSELMPMPMAPQDVLATSIN